MADRAGPSGATTASGVSIQDLQRGLLAAEVARRAAAGGAAPVAAPAAAPAPTAAQALLEQLAAQATQQEDAAAGPSGSGARAKKPAKGKGKGKKRAAPPAGADEADAPPPPPADLAATLAQRRQLALRALLTQAAGRPRDRLERALEETAAEHGGEAEAWADNALVWLACDAEFAEEVDELAAAMASSLAEEEARRAAELAPAEMAPEALRAAFSDSALLARPDAAAPLLAAPPPRRALADFLVMERSCKRWWALSSHWFERAAGRLADAVAAALAAAPAPAAPPPTAGAPRPKRQRKAPTRLAQSQDEDAAAAAGEPAGAAAEPVGAADEPSAAAAAQRFLDEQLATLRAEAFGFPSGNGVPRLFVDAAPAGGGAEVVDLE
jgi:hypothetical protein